MRKAALPESSVICRVEIGLPENERAGHRRGLDFERRVDAAPNSGAKPIDPGEQAHAALDPAHVLRASARDNAVTRRSRARVVETLVPEKLRRGEIDDDLEAIAARQIIGASVDAGSKIRRNEATLAVDAAEVCLPRRQQEIAGPGRMDKHRRRHDAGVGAAARRPSERVTQSGSLVIEPLHGSTDPKRSHSNDDNRCRAEADTQMRPQKSERDHHRCRGGSGARGQKAAREKREAEKDGDVDRGGHAGALCSPRATMKAREFAGGSWRAWRSQRRSPNRGTRVELSSGA